MPPASCPCGQPLDLYDVTAHTHCPRCGHTLAAAQE